MAKSNLSAGFFFFLGGGGGGHGGLQAEPASPGPAPALQAGGTYRVPAEGAGGGRNGPAGLPELQTVGGIKGKSFASS